MSQVIVTGGFSAGLGLTLHVLGLAGRSAWIENPGFPWARKGIELARLSLAPIPVDDEGIDVAYGIRHHPDAGLAVVTPGQQAPLGVTLSLERRLRLLDWARARGAWVEYDAADDPIAMARLELLAVCSHAEAIIHIVIVEAHCARLFGRRR